MKSKKPGPPPVRALARMRDLVPVEERSGTDDRKTLTVATMIAAMDREQTERFRRRRWAAVAAVAALVFTTGVVWHGIHLAAGREKSLATAPASQPRPGDLHVTQGTFTTVHAGGGVTVAVGVSTAIAAGDEIRSDAKGAGVLSLPRGVHVELGPSTHAWLTTATETEQRVRLELGRTDVSVPRPGGPRVFSIETPDSEVVVHGTEFSVLVERDPPSFVSVTSVSVIRGSVLVIHRGEERLLGAHESWSSRQTTATVVTEQAAAKESEAVLKPLHRREVHATPGGHDLAEQNRLFQSSLDARDANDDARAVRYLDELLARFPDSPLVDQAHIARARAVERIAARRRREQ